MRSLATNVIRLAEVAKKASLEFQLKTEPQRHKNNFKLNLNLPFLQTCVSISAVLKTEIIMQKLISMTDYVLERSDKSILQYTIAETFKNGAKITNEIFEYAKFLKIPLTTSMFIPCDKTGNVLNEVKEFDNSVGSDENYNRALRNYKIAKENVLFKGFSVKERNCNSSFFKYIENGFIAVYYFNEKSQKFEPNTDFKTIEDLIPYNLEILKK